MRIAVIDPSAGISGDMLLGALVSAGAAPEWLAGLPARLGFPDVAVHVRAVNRSALVATKVDFAIPGVGNHPERIVPRPTGDDHQAGHVHPRGEHHHHHAHDHHHEHDHHGHGVHDSGHSHGMRVSEIVDMIGGFPVSDWVKSCAVNTFRSIGVAEGKIHGVPADSVHLHEVGAIDAILDVVGVLEGFELLGVEGVYNLPVALGGGWVRAAHGELPVPAPATLELLTGFEVSHGGPVEGEATTPTGAALLRTLSSGTPPAHWRVVTTAWGAGSRDPHGYANALRIILGESSPEGARVEVLATEIDDMRPEYLEPLRSAVFQAGALECTVWSVQGKKGRLAFRLEALALPAHADAVSHAILEHSTTAGLRRWSTTRATLARESTVVRLAPDVTVRVKRLDAPGSPRFKAEYEDVVRAAAQLALPAMEVASRAEIQARSQYQPTESGVR